MSDLPGLTRLTAQIVMTFVEHNNVHNAQLPILLRSVYGALAGAETAPKSSLTATAEPAVALKKSVTPDHIVCLFCGGSFLMIKRHIASHHQMTPGQYRIHWSLPPCYPMTAPNYATMRSNVAKQYGLGRKPEDRIKHAKKKR